MPGRALRRARPRGGSRAFPARAARGLKLRIGLISDTHGLLRPEALRALAGSAHIIHAGDIGDPAILDALARIAPVTAVRGNNDSGAWARKLRDEERIELGGVSIHVVHDLKALGRTEAQAVVSGHSHKPKAETVGGVLFVNPGSAGPRRFSLPVSLGFLEIAGGRAKARLRTLRIG